MTPSSRVEPLDEERRLGLGGPGVLKPRCATSHKGKSRDCAPIPPPRGNPTPSITGIANPRELLVVNPREFY